MAADVHPNGAVQRLLNKREPEGNHTQQTTTAVATPHRALPLPRCVALEKPPHPPTAKNRTAKETDVVFEAIPSPLGSSTVNASTKRNGRSPHNIASPCKHRRTTLDVCLGCWPDRELI
ncbi:hypothetical protein TcG_01980 [Trypanosoma cruzi]|nr:hypothetical protein TcG_01980 [Trypanosoma cruzi]